MSIKIGSNMKHSYNDVFRKFTKLSRKTSVNITLPSKTNGKTNCPEAKAIIKRSSSTPPSMPVDLILEPAEDQVAMDFSGKNGKLVTNCKEIEDLKNTRPQTRLSRRISGHGIKPTANVDVDLDAELGEASWFHGLLSREEALTLMKDDGLEHGLFMVRKSCKTDHVRYILTFCMNEEIYHCQIVQEMNDNNDICYSLVNGPVFPSVESLIEHYKQKALNGLSVALRKPCQKRRKSLALPITSGAQSPC